MAKAIYKNPQITVSALVGINDKAWLMVDNLPAEHKIESIEIIIGSDRKISAKYIVKINEVEVMELKPEEIFKTKKALIKSL